ncbi:4-hydroxythreonine-4-phosphate dehydrogenase PdxA [Flavobacteriales bacterium]|nr:4-hydroxythreonine-4-phosphate dehydrogenase PdxA [Flavobacteriales bacterium]
MAVTKPVRIGITWGDPHGVGSECILKAFADERVLQDMIPVVYGHTDTLRIQAKHFEVEVDIRSTEEPEKTKQGAVHCVDIVPSLSAPDWGQPHPDAGEFARLSLEAAVKDLAANKVDALVTAPINKDTIQGGKFKFPGHTEYLADMAGVSDVLMILATDALRVGVVTGHVPIKDVAAALNKDTIVRKARLLHESLCRDFGIATPRIAVMGLNPHAGDNGLIGEEEKTVILPAVRALQEQGLSVQGPFGADGFFGTGGYKKFDGVLAMYHDQGLIPFKSLSFGEGVNFTAGLPIVRTSPDHGTAFDIAGKGQADGASLRAACWAAVDIRRHQTEHREMTSDPLEVAPRKDWERDRF